MQTVDKFACRKEEGRCHSESTAEKTKDCKSATASLQIRVEEDVGQQLDHYAEFIDASPS
jgi:hypothetical protein